MNRFKLMVLSATTAPSLSGRKIFSANCSTARFVRYGPIASVRRRTCGLAVQLHFQAPHAHDIGHTKMHLFEIHSLPAVDGLSSYLLLSSSPSQAPVVPHHYTTAYPQFKRGAAPEKTHIFPKFTCGRGSSDLARNLVPNPRRWTVRRRASSRLSMNSYTVTLTDSSFESLGRACVHGLVWRLR